MIQSIISFLIKKGPSGIIAWSFLLGLQGYSQSQFTSSYFGVISTPDEAFIQYQISVTCKGGDCSGFSISGIDTESETKSRLIGKLDSRTGLIYFKETEVISTQAMDNTFDEFCFVQFAVREKELMQPNKFKRIKVPYTAFFEDKEVCSSGELNVLHSAEMGKQIEDLKEKILSRKSVQKLLGDSVFISVGNKLDSVSQSIQDIRTEGVFQKVVRMDSNVTLHLLDIGKNDGDIIGLDNQYTFQELSLSRDTSFIQLFDKTDTVFISGIDEGRRASIPLALIVKKGNSIISTDTVILRKRDVFKLILE